MSADPPKPADEEAPRSAPSAPASSELAGSTGAAAHRRARLGDVPRIPRRAGFRVSTAQLVKIGMTLGLLVLLLVVQKPCADSVSKLVTGFGDVGSGSAINMPKPGTVDVAQPKTEIGSQYLEPMPADLTKAQYEAMVARARARAAAADASQGSSAGSDAAGSGSATRQAR